MTCPNCGEKMQQSNIVIDTLPATYEWYCKCGLVLDECDGKFHVCFRSKIKDVKLP